MNTFEIGVRYMEWTEAVHRSAEQGPPWICRWWAEPPGSAVSRRRRRTDLGQRVDLIFRDLSRSIALKRH
jgi:hypothetical protein